MSFYFVLYRSFPSNRSLYGSSYLVPFVTCSLTARAFGFISALIIQANKQKNTNEISNECQFIQWFPNTRKLFLQTSDKTSHSNKAVMILLIQEDKIEITNNWKNNRICETEIKTNKQINDNYLQWLHENTRKIILCYYKKHSFIHSCIQQYFTTRMTRYNINPVLCQGINKERPLYGKCFKRSDHTWIWLSALM